MLNYEDIDDINGEITFKVDKDKLNKLKTQEGIRQKKEKTLTFIAQIVLIFFILLIIIAFITGIVYYRKIFFPDNNHFVVNFNDCV